MVMQSGCGNHQQHKHIEVRPIWGFKSINNFIQFGTTRKFNILMKQCINNCSTSIEDYFTYRRAGYTEDVCNGSILARCSKEPQNLHSTDMAFRMVVSCRCSLPLGCRQRYVNVTLLTQKFSIQSWSLNVLETI